MISISDGTLVRIGGEEKPCKGAHALGRLPVRRPTVAFELRAFFRRVGERLGTSRPLTDARELAVVEKSSLHSTLRAFVAKLHIDLLMELSQPPQASLFDRHVFSLRSFQFSVVSSQFVCSLKPTDNR